MRFQILIFEIGQQRGKSYQVLIPEMENCLKKEQMSDHSFGRSLQNSDLASNRTIVLLKKTEMSKEQMSYCPTLSDTD